MKKDLNQVAKIEQAIEKRRGKEAVENPATHWDEEKENKYLEELKAFYKRSSRKKKTEKSEGFEVVHKKTENNTGRTCPVCDAFSMKTQDDLYMNKFECCFSCYIQYVEGREERWKTGWRPNK